jgi:hypothetical protein
LIARILILTSLFMATACATTPSPASDKATGSSEAVAETGATPDLINIERHAFELAEANRAHINQVRLGLTFIEVERIMGPPERRAARLRFDNVSIEEWSYFSDYVRHMDSLILFVGGKVAEIQSTPWDEREGGDSADDEETARAHPPR